MAARRGKSQARRSGGRNNGLPGWAWLVIGVLLAVVVILAAPRFIGDKAGDGFFRIGPQPNPDAQPQGSAETDSGFDPASSARTPAPGKPQAEPEKPRGFDFYDVLPGEEVAMTDAQLAAIQREEARRRAAAEAAAQTAHMDAAAQAADAQARAAAAAAGQTLPRPISDSSASTTAPPPVSSSQPAAGSTTPPATAASQVARAEPRASSASTTPYILQAGAFQASGDAEATKARIALLGLNARVESAQINGKTVYRVRMGPYASATELAEAKTKLEDGGLPAMAITAK